MKFLPIAKYKLGLINKRRDIYYQKFILALIATNQHDRVSGLISDFCEIENPIENKKELELIFNYAVMLKKAGEIQKARAIFQEFLPAFRKAFGAGHIFSRRANLETTKLSPQMR